MEANGTMRFHSVFKRIFAGALLLSLAAAAGCYPHHPHRQRDPVLDACLVGACIGSTYLGPRGHPGVAIAAGATAAAIYLAVEQGHHHGHHCGCSTRWHGGYRAYYWGGHWEYHDGRGWYVVEGNQAPGW